MRKKKVDIFWSPANCAIPFIGVPQIVTVHDTLLQERIQFDDRLEQFYFCKLVPFFLRRFADRVITVSYFASDRIQEIFRFPDRDIRIIYNGASLPVQRFDTRQAAMCYLEKKGIVKKRFIYVLGAESPWKNTTGILKAFKIVKSRFPDSYLVLSGIQNRASFFYEDLIRDLGIGDSVKLLGFIPANIRDALYQGADVFVYPSLFEGFGLPPLEAMAMKTPVVASDAASIPEVVSNAAFLVDARFPENLADGIIQLLSDEKIRNTCIRRGLQNIRRFDWGASAIMHRKLMKEIRKR